MGDPFASALSAVASNSSAAPLLVFIAGMLSSIGPCSAPRALAACAVAHAPSLTFRVLKVGSFVAGLVCSYACFGLIASLIGKISALSTPIYLLVAASLLACGVATLLGKDEQAVHHHARSGRFGGPFLLGASFALVISPCCTPLVMGILAYTSALANPTYGAGLLGIFALGHSLPILAYAVGFARAASLLSAKNLRPAVSVVSGGLMLALAGYYLALA